VVARLASTLGFELIKAEAARSAGARNPDATDFVMRARVLWFQAIRSPSTEGFDAAIAMYGKALAIDPDEADALAGQALAYVIGMAIPVIPYDKDLGAKVLGEADRAIALAPNSLLAYHAKSMYLTFFERRADEGIRVANEGLAINPNYSSLYASRQFAEMGMRQYEQAKSDLQQAIRLSPRDPGIGVYYQQLGFAEFGLGPTLPPKYSARPSMRVGVRSRPMSASPPLMRPRTKRSKRKPRWSRPARSMQTSRSSIWSVVFTIYPASSRP
jgi:tetratricopeptide (TPR) repeat protein